MLINYKTTVFFLFFLSLISCKSDLKKLSSKEEDNSNIPTYDSYKNLTKTIKKYKIDKTKKEQLNNFYRHFWEQNNTMSGGILVAQGKTILLEKYTGFANQEKQIPITKDTPLHIASVSKVLTSLAILKLVENNKLRLNQKVNTILKGFPYEEIRIIDLLTHRSGIINYSTLAEMEYWWKDKNKKLTNTDVLNFYTKCKPFTLFKPNTHFQYCNSNFALLALIVEKITKTPFPEAMNTMIFKPLKMKNTFVFQKKNFPHISLSYYNNGKLFPFDRYDLIYGDKNVYSTPRDLFKLSTAMFSDKFLRKSLYDSIFIGYSNEKEGVKNYGLGMRMMKYENGKKLTYHTGKWHGNNSIFVHLEDEKLTIISLGNRLNRSVYSAMTISGLFGDYPFEQEPQDEISTDDSLNVSIDSLQPKLQDSINTLKPISLIKKDSLKKKVNNHKKTKKRKTDSIVEVDF
ncbi:MAG: beta-lactamase family protein [Flavobacteriales bacterium]|nr:beta-lactamase family protein [Flavobacteriales bacterium]